MLLGNNKSVASILRALMDRDSRIGNNQNELHRRSGVALGSIGRILSGESGEPRDSTLQPLADFFGVSLAQMRGHEPLPWESGISEPDEVLSQEQRDLLTLYNDQKPGVRKAIMRLLEEIAVQEATGVAVIDANAEETYRYRSRKRTPIRTRKRRPSPDDAAG